MNNNISLNKIAVLCSKKDDLKKFSEILEKNNIELTKKKIPYSFYEKG